MRLELEGRDLAWRTAGAGPPLLLVNGYASTAGDWDSTLIDGLGRAFEVLCPDNRGMGASGLGDLSEPLTIDAMAADLVALLDARGIDRLPVAGWSMGGFVAQALACRAPERVSALVLLGTDPGGAAAVLADAGVWALLTSRAGTPREQASRLISVLFPPGPAAEIDAAFGDVVAAARAEVSTAALDAQEAAMRAWHAREPASSCSPAAGTRSWPRSPRGSPPSSRSSSVD